MSNRYKDDYGRETFTLKPCPFCGAIPRILYRSLGCDNEGFLNGSGWDASCDTDGCYLESGADWLLEDRVDVVDMWNKRITPTP